ncbi:MAG: hypothetical protein IT460_06905 [Planctomycetes bacterium]|nr:hypothetical protein [Planctomycetota bacterium]
MTRNLATGDAALLPDPERELVAAAVAYCGALRDPAQRGPQHDRAHQERFARLLKAFDAMGAA